ncbi:MAG: hypothetical protein GC134_09315 [Proteobacteria bacterium]|nr:hypothetical protein [Pseudomonadota bacterium]
MIKALPFHIYSPAGEVLSGLLQPGGETTYTALGLEPDMGLSPSTPVLLVVFNLNEDLPGAKGVGANARSLFGDPAPVREFRFCRQYASEAPDRRTRNRGQLFLSGRPERLSEVFQHLSHVAADHCGQTDAVLLAAGYAMFLYQGDLVCAPCDSKTAEKFHPQEPAAFRAVLRTLKS